MLLAICLYEDGFIFNSDELQDDRCCPSQSEVSKSLQVYEGRFITHKMSLHECTSSLRCCQQTDCMHHLPPTTIAIPRLLYRSSARSESWIRQSWVPRPILVYLYTEEVPTSQVTRGHTRDCRRCDASRVAMMLLDTRTSFAVSAKIYCSRSLFLTNTTSIQGTM